MLTLPAEFIHLLEPFAPLFHPKTWSKVQLLLVGTILAPRKRTVSSALRVLGLADQNDFAVYHHVLSRAAWSGLKLSRTLLDLMLGQLGGDGALVFGIDETLERRRGKRISARGIYRDGVRSSGSHFVKASGLRWISLMWLTPIPWAHRTWALPVLTVLAPSERYYQRLGRPHKKLTDWARQMIIQLRRWLPHGYIVLVADSNYCALALLHFCQSMAKPVTFITRMRMDSALFEPAPPRLPRQNGRPRIVGSCLAKLEDILVDPRTEWTVAKLGWYDGTHKRVEIASDTALWYNRGKPVVPIRWVIVRDEEFEPQALLCTDPEVEAMRVVEWFVKRWQMEVTFQELRVHLGIETQRQWSDLAIARTTPVLFGLFSWITLAAHLLSPHRLKPLRGAAWYPKSLPTFSDAIASVRRALWPASQTFCMSHRNGDTQKPPSSLMDRLIDTLCYAA